jgi:hypothetical protein
MTKFVHKLLQNPESSRDILCAVALYAAVILLAITVLNTFLAH